MSCPELRSVLNHVTWNWSRRELLVDSYLCAAQTLPDARYLDTITTSLVQQISHVAAVRELTLLTAARVVWELIRHPYPLAVAQALPEGVRDNRGVRERFDPIHGVPQHDPERTRAEATVSAWAVPAMVFDPRDEPRAVVIPPMR